MREPAVIVLGEALVDLASNPQATPSAELAMTGRPGGSPANVALGLARLGVPTRFAGRISRDALGSFLRRHLEQSGVDTALCVSAPEPTTTAIVGIQPGGAPSYSFYTNGTVDWQWKPSELPPNDERAAVHTGSLALAIAPGAQVIADWLTEQRSRGEAFISLDPNLRPAVIADPLAYYDRLRSLIADAHMVKLSEEDLLALEPASQPLAVARSWAELGPELVVVTHGAGGATALRAGSPPLHCAAIPVEVVDTVGAGDAFTAALLAFLLERDQLRPGALRRLDPTTLAEGLHAAARSAALTCTRAGADLPWQAELDAARMLRLHGD